MRGVPIKPARARSRLAPPRSLPRAGGRAKSAASTRLPAGRTQEGIAYGGHHSAAPTAATRGPSGAGRAAQ